MNTTIGRQDSIAGELGEMNQDLIDGTTKLP